MSLGVSNSTGGCRLTAKITMATAALVMLLLVGMYKIVNSAGGVVPLSYSSSFASRKICHNAINVSMAILLTPHFKSKGDLSVEMRPSIEAAGVLRASAERALYGSHRSFSSTSSASSTPNTLLTPNCKYRIHFIALITPKVKVHQPLLEFLGWKVVEAECPVRLDDITAQEKFKFDVQKDGAMGIDEMIKILAWKMTQYQSVVFVDIDVMFHKPFEELFDLATVSSNSSDGKTPNADADNEIGLAWTHGAWHGEKMNGGFLVFYPHDGRSNKHFDRICNLLKEADFRSDGSGWKGSGVGEVYGGRTLQGLLPYYFLKEAKSHHYELERCRYNNMVQLPKCKAKKADEVTSNHFTGECQKPFTCTRFEHPLCGYFQKEWWKVASEVARTKFGVKGFTSCYRGNQYLGMSENWQVPSSHFLLPW